VILTDFLLKKTAHMVEYGILAGLIYRMFKIYKIEEQDSGVYAVVLAMMYGISDEFHQSMIPGRTARPYDVLFDTIGAAVAILLIWNILQNLPNKHKKWPKKLGII